MTERYTGALVNDADGIEALARVSNPSNTVPSTPSMMSMKSPPAAGKNSLSSNNNNPAVASKLNMKLDKMLEQQMINDILRANGNLKSLKAFRLANEKLYKDKALEEARRKEIREPLEDALVEIDLLQGKLQRREEMIKTLRKQVFSDASKAGNGPLLSAGSNNNKAFFEESRQFKQLMYQEEESKLVAALDKVEQYKIAVNILHKEIHKSKRIISFQQSKLRDVYAGIEEMEFRHNEQIKKLEADKQIYLNMVDNRENRIERLMEDKDELSEQFTETKAELQEKSTALKQLKDKHAELEKNFDIVNKSKISFEATNLQLDKDLKISREETRILDEKYTDLLTRYDKLVLELDKMVEEGQFIPDPNAMISSPNDSSPQNDKRRSKAGVKLSEVHRAVKVNSKSKSNSKKIFEESTISTDSDDEESSDVIGAAIGLPSSKGSISGPSRSASISNPYVPSTMTVNSTTPSAAPTPSASKKETGSSNKSTASISADAAAAAAAPEIVNTFISRGMGGGRFSIRKFEEEALAIEKIASNSAIRMKDTLSMQMKELEEKLKYEQEQREQERKKAQMTQDALHNGQRSLVAEVERLNSKIGDLDKYIGDLKDELQAAKTANYMLINGQENARVGVTRSSLFSRLSHTMSVDAHYEGYEEPPVEPVHEEPSVTETHPETSMVDDKEQHEEEKSKANENDEENKNEEEEEEKDDENYMQYDMLAYMFDWDNVNKHSKETQIDMDIVSTERQIQYEVEDFMDDEELQTFHAEQAEIAAFKMEKKLNGGGGGKKWVGKEVVMQRDDEFYYQLEQLYQSFVHICQHVMPKQKMELLNINFASGENWQSKLVNEQLLIGLDIQWQVKYAIALLTAFNEMRNEFVRKFGHASEYMSLFQRSSETDPSIPDDDLRVTLAIRLIDVIIQSLHHILSPIYHIGQSTYPELEKVRAATPIPPRPPHYDSKAHLQELHDHVNLHQDPEAMIETLQDHARMILDFVDKHDDNSQYRTQTFPLTEAPLSADAAAAGPKGILNTHQESVQQKLKYYMGQSSPRNFPTNIDEVLDMIERRSRSGTPVSGSRSPSPVRSQSNSRSPSRGRSGAQSREEARGRERERRSNGDGSLRRPMTESPTAEQIIKHYINESTSGKETKGVTFTIEGSLVEDSKHEDDNKNQRSTRSGGNNKRSLSPNHRPPFTSGLLRTLQSREKETTSTLLEHSNDLLDYTRLTFDKTGVANAPYHINNVQPAIRAKTAGIVGSSTSFSDSFNSQVTSSTTSKANAIPPPSLESILASSTFSAFRAQSATGAVSKSDGSRRSHSPPRIRTASPLRFLPTELDAIQSVASSTEESIRPYGFAHGGIGFLDADSNKIDLSLSNSLIIPKPPSSQQQQQQQQQTQTSDKNNIKGRGGKGNQPVARQSSIDAEDLHPQASTPAPVPITPLFFSDSFSRASTAGNQNPRGTTATTAMALVPPSMLPNAPRQSTAPTIPNAKYGAASPRPTPAASRATRPQSSTPSAKYYSPRIHRNIVFPQADTANCALADTSIMVNIMEDPRIIGGKGNKEKDTFLITNGVTDETLSIHGQKRNMSSAKEKVTGASLYI